MALSPLAFKQELSYFHWVLGSTNYVHGPAWTRPTDPQFEVRDP